MHLSIPGTRGLARERGVIVNMTIVTNAILTMCDLIRAVPNLCETRSFFSPLGFRIISSIHSHSLCIIHMALHRDKSQGTQSLFLCRSLWSGRHPHEPQGRAEASKSKTSLQLAEGVCGKSLHIYILLDILYLLLYPLL